MIPSPAQATRYLRGAWRLLRFDREGFAAFENTSDAFWQSFCAWKDMPIFKSASAVFSDDFQPSSTFLNSTMASLKRRSA